MNTAKNPNVLKPSDFPDILPIWQPVGQSTYKITMNVAQIAQVKTAQTGVLDPLAEGVIIVLLRDKRLKKIDYAGWKKTYEFDIAFGLATDSYDGLGLITNTTTPKKLRESDLTQTLNTFVGQYTQQVPLYSAKKLNGKRMFEYPKSGLIPKYFPTKSGEIYSIELVKLQEGTLHHLIGTLLANISHIKHGEFRQQQITQAWLQYKAETPDRPIQIASVKAQLSRGLYVRSLSQDICAKLATIGFVTRLVRTQNGKYTKNNSFSLDQVYGTLSEL